MQTIFKGSCSANPKTCYMEEFACLMFSMCIHALLSDSIVKCFRRPEYRCGEKAAAERILRHFHTLLQLIYRENYCCPS